MEVVYESNTGHTEKYAKMLAKALDIPCIKLKDYKEDSKDVIYLGWVMAGMIKGYSKIKTMTKLKCVIAVGILPKNGEMIDNFIRDNKIDVPLFYLQGGVDYSKLRCIKKLLLKAVAKKIIKKGKEDDKTINVLKNGGSLVKEEALTEIINFIKN